MKRVMITILIAGWSLFGLASVSMAGDQASPRPALDLQIDELLNDPVFFAQVDGDSGRPRFGKPGRGMRGDMEQQRNHLEQLRMLKMLELLDLGEDQEVGFLTSFNAMRRDSRALDEQARAIVDSLAAEVQSESWDDAELTRLVDRAMALETEKRGRMDEFLRDSRVILTPVQQAKLIIFQKRFESEILERIGRFREAGGRGMGPGGPPDSDG